MVCEEEWRGREAGIGLEVRAIVSILLEKDSADTTAASAAAWWMVVRVGRRYCG